ncbi:MAG: type II secretion system GspH family protein [Planctomycetes bacterium]|nr:type II secretion system GspH family protein [Planctomycetota bacterium]
MTHSDRPFKSAAGFSLIELLITLSIIAILFGMLVPTFKMVRGSAEKLMCASNMRMIHYGIHGYSNDNRRRLPYCFHSDQRRYQETMALTAMTDTFTGAQEWDGLGLLWRNSGGGSYLDSCQCLFCPSHHGQHHFADAEAELNSPMNSPQPALSTRKLYCNYQYAGDRDTTMTDRPLFDDGNNQTILVSDGLRTGSDFNHIMGGNALRGDGSISWYGNKSVGYNLERLPIDQEELTVKEQISFTKIWSSIQIEVGH